MVSFARTFSLISGPPRHAGRAAAAERRRDLPDLYAPVAPDAGRQPELRRRPSVVFFGPENAPFQRCRIRPQKTSGLPLMKDPTVRGVVHLIEETKTFGQKGFRKRVVVLEQSKGTFTNFIPIEFVKDSCDAVDDLTVGEEIEVTYRLSGRRWQRDEASEAKYFLSAEGLSFKKLSGSGRAHDGPDDTIAPNDAFAEASDDDVPF